MEDSTAADIQRLAETLPEHEAENGNIGKILHYLNDLLKSGWNFKDAATNVNKSHALVQNLKDIEGIFQQVLDDREAILAVMKYQKKNCPEEMSDKCYGRFGYTMKEMWEHVQSKETIENYDEMKMGILEQIKTYRIQEANKMIQNMVKGSAFVAGSQLLKMYVAWKNIESASNLVEDPEKFTMITKYLTRMTNLVMELVGICETNPNDTSTITRKMNASNTLFNKTLSKISDIRVTIDGHIRQLDLLADYTAVDGAVSLITAGTQGFQVWYVWDELSSWAKFLGLASVALFTGIGVANCKSLCLTREKLKDLRESLRDATRLKEELDYLFDEATQASQDMDTAAQWIGKKT